MRVHDHHVGPFTTSKYIRIEILEDIREWKAFVHEYRNVPKPGIAKPEALRWVRHV